MFVNFKIAVDVQKWQWILTPDTAIAKHGMQFDKRSLNIFTILPQVIFIWCKNSRKYGDRRHGASKFVYIY